MTYVYRSLENAHTQEGSSYYSRECELKLSALSEVYHAILENVSLHLLNERLEK